MKKEFIPYIQALALKELEFDEPCFGYYSEKDFFIDLPSNIQYYTESIIAPTYSQAFKWFRDKHKLKADVLHATSNGGYTYTIWKWNFDNNVGKWERIGVINSWLTYEEAELECLKKLIKIVKTKN